MYIHNKRLVNNARILRKNMTKEEAHLWYDFLRQYHIRVIRQKVMGKYIADFYCPKAKLVIELDGSQHYEKEGRVNDEERTQYLKQFGVNVIRISNLEINRNFDGVCRYIEKCIKEKRQ